ncbi:MAG: hypothetical protein HY048_12785 [Acidobacteria bacterium]|nr:hypothetical protein [Acidobacteriota bacterium]
MTTLPDSLVVYLIPEDGGRFELYSEPPDRPGVPAGPPDGFWSRRLRVLETKWHVAVEAARRAGAPGLLARLRDRAIRSAAKAIDEQRTLWRLRDADAATLVYPRGLAESAAVELSRMLLARARRHHAWWLAIDGIAFAVSGVLAIVPGPNVIAYYFALRAVGHFLSLRGAQRGLGALAWHARPGQAGDDPRVILAHPAADD